MATMIATITQAYDAREGWLHAAGIWRKPDQLRCSFSHATAGKLVRDGVPAVAINIPGFCEAYPLVPTVRRVREPQNRRPGPSGRVTGFGSSGEASTSMGLRVRDPIAEGGEPVRLHLKRISRWLQSNRSLPTPESVVRLLSAWKTAR